MLSDIISVIESIVSSAGPLGVIVLAFIPEIIPPIPSALIPMIAGFVFLQDAPLSWPAFAKLFWMIGLPVSIGLTIGAVVVYFIVYWGGKPLILRYGRYVGVAWQDIEKIQTYIDAHTLDDMLLFVGRILPFMPSVIVNVFCGLVRWRFVPFLLYTIVGTVIRAMIMGFVGWQFATVYLRYAKAIESVQWVIFLMFAVALGVFIHHRRKIFKEESPEM
jgi:membrane protein DedA with SNARE-associated domain